MRHTVFAILLGLAPTFTPPADAAGEAGGAPAQGGPVAAQRQSPDFFFGRPRTAINVQGTWTFPRGSSDWFDFLTDNLTLDRSDFRGAGVALDVAIAVSPRLDVVIGTDYTQSSAGSEFRDLVDDNRLPIEQTTRLRQAAFTAGLRLALTERGRSVGSLAWIPRRVVPHVGAGGGLLWYSVAQFGEFVDFQDLSVFTDVLESDGWAPAAYANGGVELHLTRRLYVTLDGKYVWASPDLQAPWRGFEPLDLSGLRLRTGFAVRF